MSFQNIGAASALVQAASIAHPTGAYGGPNNDQWRVDAAGGGNRPGQPDRLGALVLFGVQLEEDAASPPAFDVTATHSGRFVTAAAGANEHGLPTNFGPGRGNWNADLDIARLLVVPVPADGQAVQGVAGTAGDISPNVIPQVRVRRPTVAAGDLTQEMHNPSDAVGGGAAANQGDIAFDLRLLYLGGLV